jgi:hypothetical protein
MTSSSRLWATSFMAQTRFAGDPSPPERKCLEARRRRAGICPGCGRLLRVDRLEPEAAQLSCTCGRIERALRGSRLFRVAKERSAP